MFFLLPLVVAISTPQDQEQFVPPKPFIVCYMNETPHEWECLNPDGGRVVIT